MAEALQSQKSAHLSKTILQKTAPQHNVADDNSSPSHQDEGVLRGQKISQILKMMAILKVILEKKMARAINNWRDVQSLMVVKQLSSKAKSRFISLKRYCRERLCRITLLMIMAVLLIRMRGSFEAGKRPQILTMMAILKVPLERRMARSMNNWRGIQSLMVVKHPSKKEI